MASIIYDGKGNIIKIAQDIETDASLTKKNAPADAKAVGNKFTELVGISIVEPADDDVPRVFFTGTLPTTKEQKKLKLKFEYYSKTKTISEWCTLKVQGDSSVQFPKKNFNIVTYHDENCEDKDKHNFKGWGKSSKFTLKANWMDHLHARNVVNARLYGQMCKTRTDYDLYPEAFRNSPNCACIDGFPVKVYANGVYQGLYTWNIAKDDFMANMDATSETDCMLIGDSASAPGILFTGASLIDETDWTDELHDEVPQWVHDSWGAAQQFVINSNDANFVNNFEQFFYLTSIIDRYIFCQVFEYTGGFNKSQAYFTYDGTKWLSSMYDLDTSWALLWDGSGYREFDLKMPDDCDAYKIDNYRNAFLDRVMRLFKTEIKTRYSELRNSVLTEGNIIWNFEHFLSPINSMLAEDYASTTANGAFVNIPSKDTNTIQLLRQIITTRLNVSDTYVSAL